MGTRSRRKKSRGAKPSKPRMPSYRMHKPSGLAVVTIAGKDHYLGKHGSRASKEAYRRLLAEHLAGSAQTDRARSQPLTVRELAALHWEHLERKHGVEEAKTKHDRIALACRPLVALYGNTPAAEFGPKALRVVQRQMIDERLSRGVVNQRVQFIRRVFRWGVAEELLPRDLAHALEALANVRRGEFGVREGRKVDPVAWEHVEPVLARVSRQVAAMIQLQWHTGMRAGELVQMRPGDIERDDDVWIYRPRSHKTAHHGKSHDIFLGPRAQELLRPFLDRVPPVPADQPVFSPSEAETERGVARRRARRSKVTPSQRQRTRTKWPLRQPGENYTVSSYRRAIDRGIAALNAPAVKAAVVAALLGKVDEALIHRVSRAIEALPASLADASIDRAFASSLRDAVEPDHVVALASAARHAINGIRSGLVQDWHPHRLRHSAATRIRKEHGLDAARVVLGHSTPAITEVYAELDEARGRKVMSESG